MWGSEVANYLTEIHIAKYNKRRDVVMKFHHHRAGGGEVQNVSVLKGTLDALALNYVTSLGTY